MPEVILTAGLGPVAPTQANPKREAIARVREILRKPDATDVEVEDALEALVELAKE